MNVKEEQVKVQAEADKLTAWLVDVQRKLPEVRERLAYLTGQKNLLSRLDMEEKIDEGAVCSR